MTKRHDKETDPNNPIQDLIDWEEHRFDPGFWPSQWWKKARFDPAILIWKRANLSSFWHTLLIYPFLALVLTGPIMYIHEEIPHAGIIIVTANVFIFLGTWFLLHKWMIKAEKINKVYGKVLFNTRKVIKIHSSPPYLRAPVSRCLRVSHLQYYG